MRTDNGSEFTNLKMLDFCKRNVIIHEFSVPYEPQKHGRIERLRGSLLLNAIILLEDIHLNKVFWEDAINTANYIHNRLPHKDINNKIPYELLYNRKIALIYLRSSVVRFFSIFLNNLEKNFKKVFKKSKNPNQRIIKNLKILQKRTILIYLRRLFFNRF